MDHTGRICARDSGTVSYTHLPAVYGKVGERLGKNGGKTDYSRLTSRQISVYKTDKALLELVDSLKPAGTAYPAHIHASGEEDEERCV